MKLLPHHILEFLEKHKIDLPLGLRYCNAQKKLLLSIPSVDENFCFDWNKTLAELRRGEGRAARGPLFKALGNKITEVIDATCGAGKDSLLMALWGYEVSCYERSLCIFLLELDAWSRLEDLEIRDRLKLNFGQALDEVEGKTVYFDPMYSKTRGKRLPQKNMQALSVVVGEDNDSDSIINKLLQNKLKKLVVKRPLKAPENGPKKSHSHEGKTARYDVYLSLD